MPTILIVEDEAKMRRLLELNLADDGFQTVSAEDAETGLKLLQNGSVDLVLTDLMMPGLDGTKLIEAIKGMSPETPAILFSGKVRMCDQPTRADVFLPKGMYAPAELLERIRLLLVRKRGPKRLQPRTTGQTSAA